MVQCCCFRGEKNHIASWTGTWKETVTKLQKCCHVEMKHAIIDEFRTLEAFEFAFVTFCCEFLMKNDF